MISKNSSHPHIQWHKEREKKEEERMKEKNFAAKYINSAIIQVREILIQQQLGRF